MDNATEYFGRTVGIIGLGPVGLVSAACLARLGRLVVAFDRDSAVRDAIIEGRAPFYEPGLDKLLEDVVSTGQLRIVDSLDAVVVASDVSLLCVGTPSNEDGTCNLGALQAACRGVGAAIAHKPGYHTVAIRSTVPPGTTETVLLPVLEENSGKQAGRDFGVCHNPEFLREASAVRDFFDSPFIMLGALDQRSGLEVGAIYEGLAAPRHIRSVKCSELLKYTCNAWHAVKISFSNEIGRLAKALSIDSREVMEVFVEDNHLNISPCYMKPGFAYGGSCLPKDLAALLHMANTNGVDVPLAKGAELSNEVHIEYAADLIRSCKPGSVGFIGLTFKSDTSDLRESAYLRLAERLREEGRQILVYDPRLQPQDNLDPLTTRGLVSEWLGLALRTSPEEVISASDVVVASQNGAAVRRALAHSAHQPRVIDLTGALNGSVDDSRYQGICW